jgi:hypothetical protein
MNLEELGQIEIVPRYVVNENRYFQCEGWPTDYSPDDDSEEPDDHILSPPGTGVPLQGRITPLKISLQILLEAIPDSS